MGVIGNLVHSSPNIKKEVIAAGALQPVIGLLRYCFVLIFLFICDYLLYEKCWKLTVVTTEDFAFTDFYNIRFIKKADR